ncbi:lipase secretion chaperone [Moritella sp. Urea-trap-13]|uniref:lipase secretion chaperone n=1 Tax=Moritella sp. Urea-trap-13 TaxID=2058327 RepID=UPI000C32B52A|nr:lipase secretion chaperone [Moritella sp. Urea-trap-13]PKH09349.1 lipase chaperone [Moritella sp. Urea-trap-13]
MSFKSTPLIIATALSGVIAVAGWVLFLSSDDAQSIATKPASPLLSPIAASKIVTSQIAKQQVSYPLTPEAINALVNQGDDVLAENTDQQAVPLLLPSSLLGSALPLMLDVNEFGDLIINKKIQHLFDFYLSAMGEESLDIIVTRIKHSLTSQLVDPALIQGMDIFSGYLQYLNQVTAIKQQFELEFEPVFEQSIDGINNSEYALENVIQVREMVLDARTTFLDDDVIAAFFGQADEYEGYMLRLAAINQNKALTDTEKQVAQAELDTTAPEWLLAQQHTANQLNQYREQYQTLQTQGASQAELQNFTQQSFSPAVADRLVALDVKRQQWQVKLAEYREELAVITNNAADENSDSEQQQLEIAQLREAYFSPQEIKRVSALDGIDSTRRSSTLSNNSISETNSISAHTTAL